MFVLFYKVKNADTGKVQWRVTQMAYVYVLAGFAALTPLVAFEGSGNDVRWWHFLWVAAVLICVAAADALKPRGGEHCSCRDEAGEE